MISSADVLALLGRWWFDYDEGNFDALARMLTDDVHFTAGTDTGATDYEEFVRADLRGRDQVMAWQREHRLDSPSPLRHHGINVHVVEAGDDHAAFRSYIFVTHIDATGVASLSTAIVTGAVRREDGELRLSELSVVLDTAPSVPLRERLAVGS